MSITNGSVTNYPSRGWESSVDSEAQEPTVNDSPAQESASGVIVLGTDYGCGKSVFTSGLAAMLKQEGFQTRAIKPLTTSGARSGEFEESFLSYITQTPRDYQTFRLEGMPIIRPQAIDRVLEESKRQSFLTFLELPGACATPVGFFADEKLCKADSLCDSAQLAKRLKMPCLLVAKHASDAMEKLVVNAWYLIANGLDVVGLATVEVEPQLGFDVEAKIAREEFEMLLLAKTGAPFLGRLKYSPSISVPRRTQGNLIKLMSSEFDCLSLIKTLNLKIAQQSP